MGTENIKYLRGSSSYKNYEDRNQSWKSSVEYKRMSEQMTGEYDLKLSKQNRELWKMYSNKDKKMDEVHNRQTKKCEEENKYEILIDI